MVEQIKVELEEKNKDMTDSINYAKRIQEAILPSKEAIHAVFPESFILYKPKDIATLRNLLNGFSFDNKIIFLSSLFVDLSFIC